MERRLASPLVATTSCWTANPASTVSKRHDRCSEIQVRPEAGAGIVEVVDGWAAEYIAWLRPPMASPSWTNAVGNSPFAMGLQPWRDPHLRVPRLRR